MEFFSSLVKGLLPLTFHSLTIFFRRSVLENMLPVHVILVSCIKYPVMCIFLAIYIQNKILNTKYQTGGPKETRTPDLLIANEAHYQLCYRPVLTGLEQLASVWQLRSSPQLKYKVQIKPKKTVIEDKKALRG